MGRRLRRFAVAVAAVGALVAVGSAPAGAVSVTFTGLIDTFTTGNVFGVDDVGTFVNGGASYTAPNPGGEVNPLFDSLFGFNLQVDPSPVGQPGVPPAALLFSWFEDAAFLGGSPLNPFLTFDVGGALSGIETLVYFNFAPGATFYGDSVVADPSLAAYEFSMAGQNFQINSLVGGGFASNLVEGRINFGTVQPGEFQPVPEPGSLLLLGSGLLGLAGAVRRRRSP